MVSGHRAWGLRRQEAGREVRSDGRAMRGVALRLMAICGRVLVGVGMRRLPDLITRCLGSLPSSDAAQGAVVVASCCVSVVGRYGGLLMRRKQRRLSTAARLSGGSRFVGSRGVGLRTCPPHPAHSRPRGVRSQLPLAHSAERPRSPRDPPDREGAAQKMGGHGDRPAAGRTGTDSATEPAGSGPDAAAAQRPAAGPGLEDALHGAPDLLAALAMQGTA